MMNSPGIISISSTSLDENTSSPSVLNALSISSGERGAPQRHKQKNSEKVINWIETCRYDLQYAPEENCESMCIRYDFDKSSKEPTFVPQSNYTKITPLTSYIEQTKKIGSTTLDLSRNINEKCDTKDYPTLKSLKDLNMKISNIQNIIEQTIGSDQSVLFPLPPKRIYSAIVDFEDSIKPLVQEKMKDVNNGHKKSQRHKKFKFIPKITEKIQYNQFKLRSKAYTRKPPKCRVKKKKIVEEIKSPRVEILSVHTNSDDENIELKNFVDDMLELDKMTEEHRKCVIESRILSLNSLTNIINKRAPGSQVQKAYKIFSDFKNEQNEEKKIEEKNENHNNNIIEFDCQEVTIEEDSNRPSNCVVSAILNDHDYAINCCSSDDEDSVISNLSATPLPSLAILPVNEKTEIKSLKNSLNFNQRRKTFANNYWNSNSNKNPLNHSITISKDDGSVLKIIYQDSNLIVAQQKSVSLWTQSALGLVLGAQNMWVPKGQVQRIALNCTYVQKEAAEMFITTEMSVAYVELWTKEHKSDVREMPVADVFAIVYFWRLRQSGLEKKALQLDNIKGLADDVQYCVLKNYPKIIVSWHFVQGNEKRTKIHSYHLAADYQTVASISTIQPVEHYVSSLHNIEDCDGLIMGCGENKVTLWNVEYGYLVATIEMATIRSPLATLWVKCDRGYLFIVQECVDQELRLIAINGMNHSWKKLQSYNPSSGFDGLKGVYMENGILIAYYSQGILCWNAQSGELIVEEIPNEIEYMPSGNHVIILNNDNIIIRHSLSHLITDL